MEVMSLFATPEADSIPSTSLSLRIGFVFGSLFLLGAKFCRRYRPEHSIHRHILRLIISQVFDHQDIIGISTVFNSFP